MHELGKHGLTEAAIFPFKAYPHTKLYDYAISLGFADEQLNSYDVPNVIQLIQNGLNPVDASRDGFVNTAQLSEIPNKELAKICQREMDQFNERKRMKQERNNIETEEKLAITGSIEEILSLIAKNNYKYLGLQLSLHFRIHISLF